MPMLKANHRQILVAKPIDGKRTRYRIDGVDGLWLHVGPSGGDVFEDWHARHAKPKLARHETDRAYYRNHIEPEFAKTRLQELKRTEIAKFRDKVASKDAHQPGAQLGARRRPDRCQPGRKTPPGGQEAAARARPAP